MIVKYFKNGVWGYIDNVRQAANMDIDASELIRVYDEEVKEGKRTDVATYVDFTVGGAIVSDKQEDGLNKIAYKRLPDGIVAVNKVFVMATENIPEEIRESGYHSENLLDENMLIENCPVNVVVLYLNDHKEYDTVVFVTNQKCFLMNDKGQTIERLV